MIKPIALIMAATALTGCMQHNMKSYEPINQAEKTVTVPPGSKGLKGEIKKALLGDGWKLFIDKNETTTEGVIDKTVAVKQAPDFGTRYRIYVSSEQFDWCLNGSPAIRYELSMIDNATSAEIFTMDGRGCENHAMERFTKLLHGNAQQ